MVVVITAGSNIVVCQPTAGAVHMTYMTVHTTVHQRRKTMPSSGEESSLIPHISGMSICTGIVARCRPMAAILPT